jgi:hypothetical protein
VTKFRSIPGPGRILIVGVAFGVFAIATAACATSYNAIYHLVDLLGLYGAGITKVFPGLVDFAFIVGEGAAILGGIMRATTRSEEVTKGWPYAAMWVCGLCTIAFNVWHALTLGRDALTVPRCVVASLPPILMMVSFQVLISIVKWTMLHLGRPLNSAAAFNSTDGYQTAFPSPSPAQYAMPGSPFAGYGAGTFPPQGAYGQMPSPGSSGNPRIGPFEIDEATKRRAVEMYLSGLTAEQLGVSTGSSIQVAMAEQGVAVSERFARTVLGDYKAAQKPANGARTSVRRKA